MKQYLLAVLSIATIAYTISCCNNNSVKKKPLSDTLAVITEKDLIPEGTAYDPVTQQVFISSTFKRKVIAIKLDGNYYDFVKEAQDSIQATIGMMVDAERRKLWVLSACGPIPFNTISSAKPWTSKLYCYDIPSKKLDTIYPLVSKEDEQVFLNDLTVTNDGMVFMTETMTSKIYLLKPGAGTIVLFLVPSQYHFLNGIAHTPDNKFLFVSANEGMFRVNIQDKKITPLAIDSQRYIQPVDGLAFVNNTLIGHQSKIITRFHLNTSMDKVIQYSVVDDQNLNSSTTSEVGIDYYYYIANS